MYFYKILDNGKILVIESMLMTEMVGMTGAITGESIVCRNYGYIHLITSHSDVFNLNIKIYQFIHLNSSSFLSINYKSLKLCKGGILE